MKMRHYFSAIIGISLATQVLAKENYDCCQNTSAAGNAPNYCEIVTPNAGPRVCKGADIFFTADFIWWKAREEGLAFASSSKATPGATTSITSTGTVIAPNVDWEPGFKAGIGWNMPIDGWDIMLEYTWARFNGHTTSTATSDATNLVVSQRNVGAPNTAGSFFLPINFPVTTAKGRWDLHFNAADLELGRNYFIGQFLSLRPHFGLKGTWQSQKFRADYLFQPAGPGVIDLFPAMKQKFNMWAVGLRTGVDTAWYFTRNWSIFGDFAISSLYSSFNVRRTDSMVGESAIPQFNFDLILTKLRNRYDSLKGVIECMAGIRCEYWSSQERIHFMLEAGWEAQLWLDQNSFYARLDTVGHGDLTLHGLTIKARLDF